ncbi:hypothetical protein BDY24DRAFT_438281 [Mrakia frigida]|uniref:uncharacterized protein n=1 Tax=Mrakia frigida TaxID=29902 RepID=UPI003FCC245D
MENRHTYVSSRHLPYIPLELKHHILRFCDPSTLANASRVSLAFLQLSSPILYEDIEIVGLKNVEKFFCSRDPSLDHPHLHPHLSLFLIRNITIVATSDVGGEALNLSFSRLPPPSSPSLLVDLLTVRPIAIPDETVLHKEHARWSSLYSLFNPRELRVFGLAPNHPSTHVPWSDLSLHHWPRLLHLHVANVGQRTFIATSVRSNEPFTLLLDLSSNWGDDWYERDLITVIECEANPAAAAEGVKDTE